MEIFRTLLLLALIFCLLGPALLLVEYHAQGPVAFGQMLPISFLAMFFFAYSMASMRILKYLMRRQPKQIVGFYLISKVFQLLLCMLIFIVYALFVKTNLHAFAINLVVFYMATLVFMTVYNVRMEHKMKKKSCQD